MENRELKACPFCGEEPTMTTVGNTSSNYDVGFDFYVKCFSVYIIGEKFIFLQFFE
mgnify:CR=1 FL=1